MRIRLTAPALVLAISVLALPPSALADELAYGYDERGRLVTITLEGGREIHYSYDDAGNIVTALMVSPDHTLRVAAAPAGAGTLGAPGISCPGDCVESFPASTMISLDPAPEPGYLFVAWSGGASGSADPLALTVDHDLGLTAHFGAADGSTDGDGVTDSAEMGPAGTDPLYDGDGNGVPDYQEGRAASLATFDGGNYVTFAVPAADGVLLRNITAVDNPSPGDTPADYRFPFGFFAFSIEGLAPGACTELSVYTPRSDAITTYFKHGPTPGNGTPHWYNFAFDGTVGAEVEHSDTRTRITMRMCDGLDGDAGPADDGRIDDPGGPARPRCTSEPDFAGIRELRGASGDECGLELRWWPATSQCGSSVSYNVYRSTSSGFTPDGSTLVASCVSGLSWTDTAVTPGQEYFYLVHAEDDSTDGAGPCASGNVATSTIETSGIPLASLTHHLEDMESDTNWVVAEGPGHVWDPFHYYTDLGFRLDSTITHSPAASWVVRDGGGQRDNLLELDLPLTLPAGSAPRLEFWHYPELAASADGVVLEYSSNDGASWHDILEGDGDTIPADPDRFLSGGYELELSASWGNPLGGRLAWSQDWSQWRKVEVDLSDFAGATIRLRWRFAGDDETDDSFWRLDDVAVLLTNPETLVLFAEDMDRRAWTAASSCNDSWELALEREQVWRFPDVPAASSETAWYMTDSRYSCESTLALAPLLIPAGGAVPVLDFWYWLKYLSSDGTVLEYSTDGAVSWHDILEGDGQSVPANPDRFLSGGYDGVLGSDGPLAGREAWWAETGDAYRQVRVDLSDLAGLAVRWRWRFGANSSSYGGGIAIDDVRLSREAECDDAAPPQVDWVAIPGVMHLVDGARTNAPMAGLEVAFSKPVADPPGDSGDDVTNPANYLLAEAGVNGIIDTTSCAAGVGGDDGAITIAAVTYDAATWSSELALAAAPLADGDYQLLVCGSTSITDLGGQPLDGDRDGSGGDDAMLSFTIDRYAPTVEGIDSFEDTGDGSLDEDEIVSVELTQLLVDFSEAMADPTGDQVAGDVSNPMSYLLVSDGGDGSIETSSCTTGPAPTDRQVAGPDWSVRKGPTSPPTAPVWRLSDEENHASTRAWHAPYLNGVMDERLEMASSVELPPAAPATLEFWHRYDTSYRRSGGVLEYSLDDGASWFDILAGDGLSIPANGGRITANGYNYTLYTSTSNPLSARPAWSYRTLSWVRSEVDLGDFAGHSLRLRWRWANYYSTTSSYPGWFVDDVRIFTTSPAEDLFMDDLESVDGVSYDEVSSVATLSVNAGSALPDGRYALLVCGSADLRDVAGNPFDGNGDGSGGDDFRRVFWVSESGVLPPGNPTVSCTSHPVGVWTADATLDFAWSGAVDNGGGIAGYSVLLDGLPSTEPDTTVDVVHSGDPHLWSSPPVAEGVVYFHLRSCDANGSCSPPVHSGPYQADTLPPVNPPDLRSISHTPGEASEEDDLALRWSRAEDGGSGLAGYAGARTQSPDWSCPGSANISASATGVTYVNLVNGEHYYHLCAADLTGNWSTAATIGPFVIDAPLPEVAAVYSSAPTADGVITADEQTPFAITQLLLQFSKALRDLEGDTYPGDPTNPDNYLLVNAGADGILQSTSCAAVGGDDLPVSFSAVDYWSPPDVSALYTANQSPLDKGLHRLLVCGSLEDAAGNLLDGDGDGTGGDDYSLDFTISAQNLLGNPNFDGDLGRWTVNGLQLSFSAVDAWGNPVSGSARFENGPDLVETLSQCVDLPGAGSYTLGGLTWTTIADPAAPVMGAEVEFFELADCQGSSLGVVPTPTVEGDTGGTPPGLEFSAETTAPAGALSARFSLVVDAAGASLYEGAFDEAVFRLGWGALIFADGFESGDTGDWSNATPQH